MPDPKAEFRGVKKKRSRAQNAPIKQRHSSLRVDRWGPCRGDFFSMGGWKSTATGSIHMGNRVFSDFHYHPAPSFPYCQSSPFRDLPSSIIIKDGRQALDHAMTIASLSTNPLKRCHGRFFTPWPPMPRLCGRTKAKHKQSTIASSGLFDTAEGHETMTTTP